MKRLFNKITRTDFVIRLKSSEYWPFGILQFPVFIYFMWLAIRERSLLFFSATNPGITMGGLLGESKYDILKKIPVQYVPKTVLISLPTTSQSVLEILRQEGFNLPVIFKPDLGERGFMVKKITDISDIDKYLKKIKINFLVQEYIDLPLEFGIFYTRFPFNEKGAVTSVVKKEMLSVTGDGRSTLKQLIFANDRAKLQWEKLRENYHDQLEEVLTKGRKIEIVSIGNHAMGTKFLDGKDLINPRLSETFNKISKPIDGFYFGRFDIRCASLEHLYDGNLKIMELNGCGAEPAHIYDPEFGVMNAIVELLKHWSVIFKIARQNHRLGIPYLSLKEGISYYRKFKNAVR